MLCLMDNSVALGSRLYYFCGGTAMNNGTFAKLAVTCLSSLFMVQLMFCFCSVLQSAYLCCVTLSHSCFTKCSHNLCCQKQNYRDYVPYLILNPSYQCSASSVSPRKGVWWWSDADCKVLKQSMTNSDLCSLQGCFPANFGSKSTISAFAATAGVVFFLL